MTAPGPPPLARRSAPATPAAALAAALLAAAGTAAGAEITASSLLESRLGRDPYRTFLPANRVDVYEQVDLELSQQWLRAGGRFEANRSSTENPDEPGYAALTQRWAEWDRGGLRVRVGSFTTILGRGIVHRSFELPGVVLEQVGFPSRYAQSREMDGALVEGRFGKVAVRGFSGRPNTAQFSPAAEALGIERRSGVVTGGQLTVGDWRGASAGVLAARATQRGVRDREYGGAFLELDPLRLAGVGGARLPLYVEYDAQDRTFEEWWELDTGVGTARALYAGGNLLWGAATLSAEWKDYGRRFEGVANDPPPLVREHAAPLLNRSTHFQLPGERGYQLEAVWSAGPWGAVTANWTRIDGQLGSPSAPRAVRFEERFLELHATPERWPAWQATAFAQQGQDETEAIVDRRIAGLTATWRFLGPWSATADYEVLHADRGGFFPTDPITSFTDRYGSLGVARAGWGSAAVVWQRTTDPVEEDPEDPDPDRVAPNTFLSGLVTAGIGAAHEAALFLGERRSGLACTAGVCYRVQAFRGVELRVTSRFPRRRRRRVRRVRGRPVHLLEWPACRHPGPQSGSTRPAAGGHDPR